ncbi:YqaJ viral recombinase family protein [Pseudomonas syringae]|uniref:YqaJ viral recombinase family protein n=1 Tax=Pseudomonas syringae TaxID=317 RepID=UPI0024657EB7|nr:YqaJ viral recombinase family protein [Pseudomonas syringae]MDH4602468.1 YqaJ viral recombinase family protein [Pseudomonas syringae pv. papulans]
MIDFDLKSLPQFGVIKQSDAERWTAGIIRYHADRAHWHAKRLTGIGGSEIGAVIRGIKELRDSGFSTLSHVVRSKLLMRLPEFQTDHMRRGNVLEHLARLSFLYRYKAAQDFKAMKAMEAGATRPGYEWLIGNTDDLIVLGGRRWVNDYKVPSSFSEEIEHDYSAQIHHYGLKAKFAGVRIDGHMLTKLDLAPELALSLTQRVPTMSEEDLHTLAKTIAMADVPGMRVVSLVVENSREMQLDILECGNHCWNEMVLAGHVPQVQKGEMVELSDEKMLEVGRYQQQYAMAKAGMKYLDGVAKNASASIAKTLDGVDIAGKEMPLGLVKVVPNDVPKELVVKEALRAGATPEELSTVQKDYSLVALIEEVKRLNGDAEAPHLYSQSLDPKKAEAFLSNANIDIDALRTSGVTVALSTKGVHKDIGKTYQASAGEVFCDWIDKHSISCELDDSLEETTSDFDVFGEMALEAASGTLSELFAGASEHHADHANFENQRPMSKGARLR